MSAYMQASRAYQTSSESRSLRAQEADIFHRANGAMRTALDGTELDRVRAVADNRRLWLTVLGLVQDPHNQLPVPVRASLMSVGRSVQREMDAASPRPRLPDRGQRERVGRPVHPVAMSGTIGALGNLVLSLFSSSDSGSGCGQPAVDHQRRRAPRLSNVNPVTALQTAEANSTKDIAQTAADPTVARDIASFRAKVAAATSPAQLLQDPTVLKVLLTANGLGDQAQYPALAQKALLSDTTDTTSLGRHAVRHDVEVRPQSTYDLRATRACRSSRTPRCWTRWPTVMRR